MRQCEAIENNRATLPFFSISAHESRLSDQETERMGEQQDAIVFTTKARQKKGKARRNYNYTGTFPVPLTPRSTRSTHTHTHLHAHLHFMRATVMCAGRLACVSTHCQWRTQLSAVNVAFMVVTG